MSKHVRVFIGIALVLLTLFPVTLTAGWLNNYGREDSTEMGYGVLETFDGGFIVSAYAQDEGVWVIRTDQDGNIEWDSYYDPEMSYINSNCIRNTHDESFILTGSGFRLLKIDLWGFTLFSSSAGYPYESYWVEQASSDCYIATGKRDTVHGVEDYASLVWVFKADTLGNVIWENLYGVDGYEIYNQGKCILETADGNYMVCGFVDSKAWLAKLDTFGVIIWEDTYLDGAALSMIEDSDGSIVMAGVENDSGGVLIKTSSDGELLWKKNLRQDATLTSVTGTSDGGYVVVGYTIDEFEMHDVLVIKTNGMGEEQWTKIYGDSVNTEWAEHVERTADGGYIVSGSVRWTAPEPDDYDVLLLKLDANGDTVSTYISETAPQPVSGFAVSSPIGPQVLLTSYSDEIIQLGIFDAAGSKVDELLLDGPGTVTWGSDFEPGVYFVVPRTGNQSAHKVVLVR